MRQTSFVAHSSPALSRVNRNAASTDTNPVIESVRSSVGCFQPAGLPSQPLASEAPRFRSLVLSRPAYPAHFLSVASSVRGYSPFPDGWIETPIRMTTATNNGVGGAQLGRVNRRTPSETKPSYPGDERGSGTSRAPESESGPPSLLKLASPPTTACLSKPPQAAKGACLIPVEPVYSRCLRPSIEIPQNLVLI